jgi:Mrp family chromosome partitioning ATPase
LHKVFGLIAEPGLNGLGEHEPVKVTKVRPSLALLAPRHAGCDPLSFLASTRMREIIAAARNQFDWVVLDTPPVALLPDANILSSMVDAVVVVALMGRTPYKAVADACDAVGRDRVFGVVLNRADERAAAHAGYYAYGELTVPA